MSAEAVAPGLSLRRQLLVWLLLPQLVLWAVGGALAYRIALSYAEAAIDQSLTQSMRALARQVKPIGSGLLVDFPRAAQAILEQDPKDRLIYMVSSPPGSFLLGNSQLPDLPAGRVALPDEPLLYDAQVDGRPVRVAAMEFDYGEAQAPQRLRVQAAKGLAVQQRLARELIADMLAPLLALGLLLSAAVYAGVTRGLMPLRRLAEQIENRSVQDLHPIALDQAPREVHALAAAINALLTAVQRSVVQEKRFLNDAAHQLRTPLAGLISQAELAQTEPDAQAMQARLDKVLSGARRSAHLVHQLLLLARSETQLRPQALDLAQLAREVAREWTPRAVAAGADLGFEGDDHASMLGDPLQLREALSNLIDNALRYAGAGSRVTVSVSQLDAEVRLAVEDDGPGLGADQLPLAFERFWRGSEAPGGCGLGLAIVQEIARRHGGSADAEAAQPHGLRVQMRLPRTAAADAAP